MNSIYYFPMENLKTQQQQHFLVAFLCSSETNNTLGYVWESVRGPPSDCVHKAFYTAAITTHPSFF